MGKKLVVIDGNSILNRAFYGIMGSKMLMTEDGTYTNAVYGFLAIMFKMLDEEKPDYLAVAFDLKAPTKRHELYKDYKGTRKGMPDELAQQMPLIKDVLKAMNIEIITKEGYEADDILGTLSRFGEANDLDVRLLTGDRDSFQLVTNKTTILLPHTKAGKTETEIYDLNKIHEVYNLEPDQLKDVKGLMGDTSDNIPGVSGIGEKTALSLIQKFSSIENMYKELEAGNPEFKGKQKEKLESGKEMAYLSKTLGTIDVDSPIEKDLEKLKYEEWNKPEVYRLFKELRFKRYIDRFKLDVEAGKESSDEKKPLDKKEETTINKTIEQNKQLIGLENKVIELDVDYKVEKIDDLDKLIKNIQKTKELIFIAENKANPDFNLVIMRKIINLYVYDNTSNTVFIVPFEENIDKLKSVFEDDKILKISHDIKVTLILLKQAGIEANNFMEDTKIAGYLINSTSGNYNIEDLAYTYFGFDIKAYLNQNGEEENAQTNLFDEAPQNDYNVELCVKAFLVAKLWPVLIQKLKDINSYDLYKNIEMPSCQVLADMQYVGIFADQKEIIKFGEHLKDDIEEIRIDIYKQAGEQFNVNSTQQLGHVLFDKLKLTPGKKTKNGYATDVDTLNKIKDEHPIVNKILDYRKLVKLNSTYVDGLMPFIHSNNGRVHTYFHQTVTATGRLSSTDPNLQNIPVRTELGKKIRKFFKADKNKIFVDSDYSQIELRVLAHISNDEKMIDAFKQDKDIHTITASQVFGVEQDSVSKQLRSRAKAVNFGIVYGISEYGLAEQIGMLRNDAREYINKYLETYKGINDYMHSIVEQAVQDGYVTTVYGRRRYIPEITSNNYNIREFGKRCAMNTPIQGTAADIMKIAMVNVYNEFKKQGLSSKIVLQIHDELLIETTEEEKEQVKEILKTCMEGAVKLKVPLKVDINEGKNWFLTH